MSEAGEDAGLIRKVSRGQQFVTIHDIGWQDLDALDRVEKTRLLEMLKNTNRKS